MAVGADMARARSGTSCAEAATTSRCTVERLMKAMELQGVVRGKKVITTTPIRHNLARTTR
tara:strand:- start:4135 stop:4317 length:183 start_codon:yes stop_codon:yes gene_type:complete